MDGPIVRNNPHELSVDNAYFHDGRRAPRSTKLHRSRRSTYTQFFSSTNVMASETLVVKEACMDYTWAFGESLELIGNMNLALYDDFGSEGPAAVTCRLSHHIARVFDPRESFSYQKLNSLPYLVCETVFEQTVLVKPEKFRPERWLDKDNPIDEKRHFVAFGNGSRSCPGKDFATNLVQLTLATLVQRFEFQVVDTDWERDVAVSRESTLTAPSAGSTGIKFKVVRARDALKV
ncbi:cytochrome P450 [Xylariaceae sp. FL0594]|nr:cytochrome P450 [Xylariaceae sp. FL0594]